MAESKFFHFTLGPVQGFVAQARRTRDFWAGSFLLSWLAGVAMAEVKRQGGAIHFPVPPDDYLEWITNDAKQGEPPRQGAIPNRFKAFSAQVPEGFKGGLVADCIRAAWMALAEHVWVNDGLGELDRSGATRAIWKRQHANFWDISWVITGDDEDSSVMDQRKNWRSHYATEGEPGVKCMVMDGWQELSGCERPIKEKIGEFWNRLRESDRTLTTDLAEGEYLCGLAYVKRRFVRHFHDFRCALPSGLSVRGWPLSAGMPSISYMAAVHWLERILTLGDDNEIRTLLEAAKKVQGSRDEWETRINCLRAAAGKWNAENPRRQLLALDASMFFEHVQENARRNGFEPEHVNQLRRVLSDLGRKHQDILDAPSPFYALLLMDGDSLGSHMSDKAKQTAITTGLERFTRGVPGIIEAHNGFLIYAGGDDVLAILPMEDAMQCASAVRRHYLASFEGTGIPTTISAAIEYAHVKTPLGQILADAHHLLDDVAKDGAGRDALAVRVWKPGGLALEWAQPWEVALRPDGQLEIEHITERLRVRIQDDVQLSNKFFFKIEERFQFLNPPDEKTKAILSADEAADLLAVDFVNSADNRKTLDMKAARDFIEPLLVQSRAVTRDLLQEDSSKWDRSNKVCADAALLVRFLAHKGVEQ